MHSVIRRATLAASAALLACVAVLAGPFATPARADVVDLDVYTADEFVAAVATVNDNDVDETFNIWIHEDLDFTQAGLSVLGFNPEAFRKEVFIEGSGHEIYCDQYEGPCERWLEVYLGENGFLSINGVTVTGFTLGAVYSQNTDLSIVSCTFEENSYVGTEDGGFYAYGAALINQSGSHDAQIEILDSYFRENWSRTTTAEALGGAVYTNTPTFVSNTTFDDNSVAANEGVAKGAAIYAEGTILTIVDSTFINNYAIGYTTPYGAWGGAVHAADGTVDVSDSEFAYNSSTGSGGAIGVDLAGHASVRDTVFEGNYATYGGAIAMGDQTSLNSRGGRFEGNWATLGGAIRLYGAYADIVEATFFANSANSLGGAIWAGGDDIEHISSEAWVERSVFHENQASSGGALGVFQQSELTVDSSTFTENEAYDGAAISSTFSSVDLAHVTIANNVSYDEQDEYNGGGQIWMQGVDLRLRGSVLVDAGDNRIHCVQHIASSIETVGANAADDDSCFSAGELLIADPEFDAQLGPLQFNGGPTWTMVPAPESELVDFWSADGQDGCNAETSDQRGVLRPQGDACDIGAVETLEPIFTTVTTPGGVLYVRILNAVDADQPEVIDLKAFAPAPPAGVAFPYGALGLGIEVWDDGWPADLEIWSPAPTNELWKLFDGEWVNPPGAASYAVEGGTVWTFRVTDGGWGDNDVETNAFIVDPVALGAAAAFTG